MLNKLYLYFWTLLLSFPNYTTSAELSSISLLLVTFFTLNILGTFRMFFYAPAWESLP